ncbi:MAG: hypothetical protein AB7I27_09960 [Bacteriovoracaceae bacterium]
MKQFLAVVLLLSSSAFASSKISHKFSIQTFQVLDNGGFAGPGPIPTPPLPTPPLPTPTPTPTDDSSPRPDRMEQVGKVVTQAKDVVALGESTYDLVHKGKPTNVTEYAPVSVVPRDPTTKEYVDPFDLESFSMPVEKKLVTVIKSAGIEVVRFSYTVVYSYGGSYNGAGKYLTGVMIVPTSIKTRYGWDVNASMKIGGIMNHGTKANPIAGLMLAVKYQMNSWTTAFEQNDMFHITGDNQFKASSRN